ncbi:hypothetical protein TWF481_006219 [Arthrobotrys musiformis]|uniref:Uncharacterized protein n=1 Tax=Arthrobotrys musiformis TaxID=47236 RepID=A0AAV9WI10_9PEZI
MLLMPFDILTADAFKIFAFGAFRKGGDVAPRFAAWRRDFGGFAGLGGFEEFERGERFGDLTAYQNSRVGWHRETKHIPVLSFQLIVLVLEPPSEAGGGMSTWLSGPSLGEDPDHEAR